MALSAPAHSLLTQEFAETAERLQLSTVHVRSGRMGAGSGVIWRPDGLIITNAHVARAPQLQVELTDGRELDGEVMSTDPRRDLAAVRVEAKDLPAAAVAASDALRVGQLVVAVGNPLGMSGAMTVGIIHAIAPAESRERQTWIQADVHLAPGNSGGPLADVLGRVVGINSMVYGGLGLAVPSNEVVAFLRDRAPTAFLGVTTQPVLVPAGQAPDEPRLRRTPRPNRDPRETGLLILQTEPGSPAERAGLSVGDILTGVNGLRFQGPRDLVLAIQQTGPGQTIRLDLLRGGRQTAVDVVLDEPLGRTEARREAA